MSDHSRKTGAEFTDAVFAATLNEVGEHGLRGASMERIATRAGTGKASLYRRWPNVRALSLDVFLTLISQNAPVAFPDTGNLRDDLYQSIRAFCGALEGPLELVLRELLAEAAHDPTLVHEFHARYGKQQEIEVVATLQRAMARGEIPTQPISPMILELPAALVVHRLLMDGNALSDAETAELVDTIMLPLLHASPSR